MSANGQNPVREAIINMKPTKPVKKSQLLLTKILNKTLPKTKIPARRWMIEPFDGQIFIFFPPQY